MSAEPLPTTDSFQEFLRQRRFPGLDGLRCLSILAVIAFHAFGHETSFRLVARGDLGVELFFAISGFLITSLLLRERMKTGKIALVPFYVRRALRIFPLYFAVLGLYLVIVFAFERDVAARAGFFQNLPAFATYTSNWFVPRDEGNRVIFYFAWSLATEEQFYLVWPVVLGLLPRTLLPCCFMAALLGTDVVAEAMIAAGTLNASSLPVRIVASIAAPICAGSLVAALMHVERTFRWFHAVLGKPQSAAVLLLLVIALMLWPVAPDPTLAGLLALLVAACALGSKHWLAPVLELPLVRYVGTISYGLYLLHMLALNVSKRLVPNASGPLLFLVTLALAMLIASISYRFFEKPFLAWKERLSRSG